MSVSEPRVNRLYERLTPKERASLLWQAFKADQPEPPGLRRCTPDYQLPMVDEYIRHANATQHEVTWYAVWLLARLETIEAEVATVRVSRAWGMHAEMIGLELVLGTGEPITRSDYLNHVEAARKELIPIRELAEQLVEEDDENEELDDDQYEKRSKLHEKRLRELLALGQLIGRGARVRAGSFYEWRKEACPVERGLFAVFADEEVEQVQQLGNQRSRLRQLLGRAPLWPSGKPDNEHPADLAIVQLQEHIAADLIRLRSELLAVDQALIQAAVILDGEELIHPETRRLLDELNGRVQQVAEELRSWDVTVQLPVRGDGEVAGLIERLIYETER